MPVHSSVSGVVKSIETVDFTTASKQMRLLLRMTEKIHPKSLYFRKEIRRFQHKELQNLVLEAGIVGLGGACFPTHKIITS